MPRVNHCIDCGKEISHKATRCVKCSKAGFGKSKPGLPPPKNYCVDCGVEIGVYGERCKSCAARECQKHKKKPLTFCVDCGVEISRGCERCQACENTTRYDRDPTLASRISESAQEFWTDEMRKKHSKIISKLWQSEEFVTSFQRGMQSFVNSERYTKAREVISEKTSGPNNPNWKGGIAHLPYKWNFNDKTKGEIKERDEHMCVLCWGDIPCKDNRLYTHHINYDKMDTRPENLVSLCAVCHGKTNYNRDYWIEAFELIKVNFV